MSAVRASAARYAAAALLALLALPSCAGAVEPTGTITEIALPGTAPDPSGIAAGPDGNMWVTEYKADKILRVTPAGAATEFPLPQPESGPTAIAMGPEGNLWFTENGAEKLSGRGERIGRITPSGAITEFSTLSKESGPEDIALGADGNLWFSEGSNDRVGRITPAGVVSEFPTKHTPGGITQGPDGNVWFTEPGGNTIGMITPTGTVREFVIPLGAKEIEKKEENTEPEDITAGLDGNLWFTESRVNRIGRITPAGTIEQFPIPTEGSGPLGIAPGQDGNVWFTEFGYGGRRTVGRITPTGGITEFLTPTSESGPFDLAPGPAGNLWLTERSKGKLGIIATGGPAAVAQPPAITGGGVAGNLQVCNASWASWGLLQPSFTLFPFDGYGWYLDGVPVGSGQSYTPSFAQLGHALTCSETITYAAPFLVTTAASSAPVTVNEPPPAVSGAAESATLWREGKLLARISAHRARHRAPAPPPVGTTFSFALNEPASVALTFTQSLPGRRVGRGCVAKTRRNAHRRACVRTVTVGVITFAGHPGTNAVAFQGRISSRVALKPGRYAVVIGATNVTGAKAAPATLRFTIAPSPVRKRFGRHH